MFTQLLPPSPSFFSFLFPCSFVSFSFVNVTVLTFDVQYTPQLSITKNYQEAYMFEDLAPMVDKGVDSTWQKMVDNDRVSLSKGTSPTFIVAYILFFIIFTGSNICHERC